MQNSTIIKTGSNSTYDFIEILAAVLLLTILLPVFIINIVLALAQFKKPISRSTIYDATGVSHPYSRWRLGLMKQSLLLLKVLYGDFSLCGMTLSVNKPSTNQISGILKPGLVSIHQLHQTMGYIEMSHAESLKHHEQHRSIWFDFSLAAKFILARVFFSPREFLSPGLFELLGININNLTTKEALSFIFDEPASTCRSIYFVNAHSVNVSCSNPGFRNTLNNADCILADGSGVRMGATSKGIRLKDNINGTDFLPHICRRLQKNGESLYLFGAQPKVAETAASNLEKQYPGLRIAGTHHGYIQHESDHEIVDRINRSGAALCLVALGSPIQEQWIEKNKHRLTCHTAMAVGGLFDFYSGKIARAPRWMREIGMEWLFRLAKEPKTKFKRYVIGNPLYIARIFFAYKLKQHTSCSC